MDKIYSANHVFVVGGMFMSWVVRVSDTGKGE